MTREPRRLREAVRLSVFGTCSRCVGDDSQWQVPSLEVACVLTVLNGSVHLQTNTSEPPPSTEESAPGQPVVASGKTLTFTKATDSIVIDGNQQFRTQTKGSGKCP